MTEKLSPDDEMRRLLAQLSPAERLKMCTRMFHTAKVLAKAGILSQEESTDSDALRRALFLRFYAGDFSQERRDEVLKSLANP